MSVCLAIICYRPTLIAWWLYSVCTILSIFRKAAWRGPSALADILVSNTVYTRNSMDTPTHSNEHVRLGTMSYASGQTDNKTDILIAILCTTPPDGDWLAGGCKPREWSQVSCTWRSFVYSLAGWLAGCVCASSTSLYRLSVAREIDVRQLESSSTNSSTYIHHHHYTHYTTLESTCSTYTVQRDLDLSWAMSRTRRTSLQWRCPSWLTFSQS